MGHLCVIQSIRPTQRRTWKEASKGGKKREYDRRSVKMSIQYEVEQLADSYGVADSFPKDFDYGEEEADIEGSPVPSDSKPRILLMGLRRSGKSSIQKVSDVELRVFRDELSSCITQVDRRLADVATSSLACPR